MGSYSNLSINGLALYSVKDDVNPTTLMLFTEKDKRIRPFHSHDSTSALSGADSSADTGPNDDEKWDDPENDDPENIVEYAIPLSVAKDRLEFMGFTASKIRRVFREGVEERLAELAERRNNPSWANVDALRNGLDREEQILRNLTYEVWLEEFTNILRTGLTPSRQYWYGDKGADEFSALFRYMMGSTSEAMFGFPSYDARVFLGAVCELTDPNAELVYDITELVESENVDVNEDLCAWARRQLAEDFLLNHKIIVLTEGVSDCRSLEGALRLLYPHLSDYYSFMDFEGARVPGGAGTLATTVKAFIGADVVNRIVAFFDNDTAALSAMRSLRNIEIPENVRILRYPNLEIARNYPTLGPQGTMLMDINGLACSVELYYGIDILRNETGDLTPIQWRGYDNTMQQYQGEIINKAELQAKFAEKIQKCQIDASAMQNYDWSGMRAILDCLRSAFHDEA